MKLLYIGSGFVGACSAAVAADSGHEVLVFDLDEKKIAQLGTFDRDSIEQCLYEKGLGDLLVRNKERVVFTIDYELVIRTLDTVDAVFLCLPTPEIGETGESDLRFYRSALEQLAPALAARCSEEQTNHVVLINKSTVPIEMIDITERILADSGVSNVGVVSNPEFLVEGKAIEGSLKPDRIVIGASTEEDFAVMRSLYRRFYDAPNVEYIEVNPKEAAAGKLLANFVLFNKLAVCFDVVGRVAEEFPGIQYEHLRKILGSDDRIGSWGLYDSLYAGGSCFIKDARSLAFQLRQKGSNSTLIDHTYLANRRQLEHFLDRIQGSCDTFDGKSVSLLGLAFKRDTNDVRNSPSIDIVRYLVERGVKKIYIYDPVAVDNFLSVFAHDTTMRDRMEVVSHEYTAAQQSDIIIIATDWPQFRGLADILLAEQRKELPIIADGRRMLQHRYADLAQAGYTVVAVGSPCM